MAVISNSNAYIGLGSNLGDRAGNLLLAIRGMLEAGLAVSRLSQIYETEPVETFAQPAFLNMVAEVRSSTGSSSQEVMERLQGVEHDLGRTRSVPMGPRTIDLDLLLYQDEQRNTEFLTLPHPRLHRRRFVLVPLAELAPYLVHPGLHRTMAELLQSVPDDSAVRRWIP
jgi:2-amino-4-hydroxy-6-hydroxymethyldihydropteridine diphosphokinase